MGIHNPRNTTKNPGRLTYPELTSSGGSQLVVEIITDGCLQHALLRYLGRCFGMKSSREFCVAMAT